MLKKFENNYIKKLLLKREKGELKWEALENKKKKTLNSITPSLNDFEAEFPFYSFFMLLTFTVLY